MLQQKQLEHALDSSVGSRVVVMAVPFGRKRRELVNNSKGRLKIYAEPTTMRPWLIDGAGDGTVWLRTGTGRLYPDADTGSSLADGPAIADLLHAVSDDATDVERAVLSEFALSYSKSFFEMWPQDRELLMNAVGVLSDIRGRTNADYLPAAIAVLMSVEREALGRRGGELTGGLVGVGEATRS